MIMSRNKLFEKLAEYRKYPEGYYHMVFDSIEDGQIFHSDEEFAVGMNIVAIEQYVCGLVIIVFNWMINHGHFLVWGNGNKCVDFFLNSKRRLNSMIVKNGHKPLDDDYGFKLVRINDEKQLEDNVIYIGRNPYKARHDRTPSGYIWGTNYLIFSDVSRMIHKTRLKDMHVMALRNILGTKTVLPGDYLYNEELGIILPESYARTDIALKALGSSSNYCTKLIRNMDAHLKIAEGIGESIRLDDNELDYTIWSLLKNRFKAGSVAELSNEDKCKMAVMLRKKYYVDIKRICRKIGLPLTVARELLD